MHKKFDLEVWREVESFLEQALELPDEARAAWLADLANTRPDVARTVNDLLAERDRLNAQGFLVDSPAKSIEPPPSGTTSPAGKTLGPYKIERLIGRGGMGEVWLAARGDGRFEGRYAVKFLDAWLTHHKLVERFREEGRLLARLAHPNIARLMDAGSSDEGRQFLVLEYVDGERIDRYCESRNLSIDARVRLFLGVVSAVAHAHSHLIVHRDLKPSNVLVTADGTVKLLDFGIAKLLRGDVIADDVTQTSVEDTIMTPEYAAPEQLLGEIPSTGTDVYQLGMLLFALLTGSHPRKLSGTRAERIKAALTGRIPRASDFASKELRKTLRGDLDAILTKALNNEVAQRYSAASAFAEDLERYLNRQAVTARRGTALYVTRKFIARHRFAVLGSALAVTGLCVLSIVALQQADRATHERDRAVALASRNEAVTEFLGKIMTEAAESAKPVTVSEMLTRSEQLALIDSEGNSENRAAVLKMLSVNYLAMGDYGKAARLAEQAMEALGDSDNPNLRAELICGHAYAISTLGQIDAALREISRELDHPPADARTFVECLHDRALIATTSGDDNPEVALRYATAALMRLRALPAVRPESEANYLMTVGDAYHLNGYDQEASSYFEQALQKLGTRGQRRGAIAIVIRNNWAVSSQAAGAPRKALELIEESMGILSERDPTRRPPAYLLLNRARALELIGLFLDSQAQYQSALRAANESKAKYLQLYCLLGLVDIHRQLNQPVAAQAYLAQARELLGPKENEASLASIRLALSQGWYEVSAGRIDQARQQFERALISKRNRVTLIDVQLGKAEAELLAGETQAAEADARLALQTATQLQGRSPYSRQTGLAWLTIGRIALTRKDQGAAQQAIATAIAQLANTVDANHPALRQARQLAQKI